MDKLLTNHVQIVCKSWQIFGQVANKYEMSNEVVNKFWIGQEKGMGISYTNLGQVINKLWICR